MDGGVELMLWHLVKSWSSRLKRVMVQWGGCAMCISTINGPDALLLLVEGRIQADEADYQNLKVALPTDITDSESKTIRAKRKEGERQIEIRNARRLNNIRALTFRLLLLPEGEVNPHHHHAWSHLDSGTKVACHGRGAGKL